jgi:hypothetical protein
MDPVSHDLDEVRSARAILVDRLRGAGWCRGVGIAPAEEGYALRVDVSEHRDDLPLQVSGVPVEVRVVGDLTLQPETD